MLNPLRVDPVIVSLFILERIHLSEFSGNDSNLGVLGYALRYKSHIRTSFSISDSAFFISDKSMFDDVVKGIYSFGLVIPTRRKYSIIRKSGHLFGFCLTLASIDRKYSAFFRSSGHRIVWA